MLDHVLVEDGDEQPTIIVLDDEPIVVTVPAETNVFAVRAPPVYK